LLFNSNKYKLDSSSINKILKSSKKYITILLKHQIKNQVQEQRMQRMRQERNKLLQKKEKKLTKKVVKLKQFDITNNTKYTSNIILSQAN